MSPKDVKAAAQASPAVMITVVIVAGLVTLGVVASVMFLVWKERDASAVLGLVNLLVSGAAAKWAIDARSVAQQVREQSNGTQTKLIDGLVSQQQK